MLGDFVAKNILYPSALTTKEAEWFPFNVGYVLILITRADNSTYV